MNTKLSSENYLNECMIGMKVYDICRQQDCLVPTLNNDFKEKGKLPIKPARNGTAFPIQILNQDKTTSVTIQPNDLFCLKGLISNLKIVPDTLETVITVNSITKSSCLGEGYWDVVIQYRFNYAIQLFYANEQIAYVFIDGKPANAMQAYSTYKKQVTLYGGKGVKGVVNSLGILPNFGGMNPIHFIQAKADILSAEICELPENQCTPQPTICGGTCTAVCVTIGLFTIIALGRMVKYNNISLGSCNIPECDQKIPAIPCELFNELPFPFEEFNPDNE
ncbi:conserved hypothetical protein [Clostridium botulinum C str. Eklund]|nr:conserved hypothetical protein [Clostridium botulinum C str. Eklund]NEZ48845.1 hypothetical protein [Clostridium botulinum]